MATLLSRMALGLAGAAALTLGGCYDDGYGYGGVSVGVGGGGYYGYDDPYYGGYYGGYPGYGWFDGFYYPGSGYYVYDRGGRRYGMRDRDRAHWQGNRGDRQAGNRRGAGGVAPPGAPRPDDSRWQGRRDGQQRDGSRQDARRWQGEAGSRGGARGQSEAQAPVQSGDGAQRWRQRGGVPPESWSQRRGAVPQGQAAGTGASSQRFERPQAAAPRLPRETGSGRYRQRSGERTPQQ